MEPEDMAEDAANDYRRTVIAKIYREYQKKNYLLQMLWILTIL